jgi:acetyl-CoA synthetase
MKTIEKRPADLAVRPNLLDYRGACERFTWSGAHAALSGLPHGGGLNIAHEAVVRHALASGSRTAIRWLGKEGQRNS